MVGGNSVLNPGTYWDYGGLRFTVWEGDALTSVEVGVARTPSQTHGAPAGTRLLAVQLTWEGAARGWIAVSAWAAEGASANIDIAEGEQRRAVSDRQLVRSTAFVGLTVLAAVLLALQVEAYYDHTTTSRLSLVLSAAVVLGLAAVGLWALRGRRDRHHADGAYEP